MEAYSMEDRGEGIQFCVYCFNVQPGIEIDYLTGESRAAGNEKWRQMLNELVLE